METFTALAKSYSSKIWKNSGNVRVIWHLCIHYMQTLLADQAEALMEEAEDLISLIPNSIT